MRRFSPLLIVVAILLFMGCNSSKTSLDPHSSQFENDCYPNRTAEYTFTNQEATIIKVTDRYLLSTQESKRFLPCDIPAQYQTEGIKVLFSGQRLSTFPNERVIGTPLLLTELSLSTK